MEPRRDRALVWRSVLALRRMNGVMGDASETFVVGEEKLEYFYRERKVEVTEKLRRFMSKLRMFEFAVM